jgi:anti-anti-sigma factor
MNIERKDSESEATFIIMDELVSMNVSTLMDELNHFIRTDTKDAIIDLSYVRKIDSISIASLIRIKNALAEDGRTMHLTNPNETVLHVLELAGLEKFLMES